VPPDLPDNRVRRFLIPGKSALTPEGLATFYAAIRGWPVTDADVAEFRRLQHERANTPGT
jgi:hypothetical protein